MDALLQAALSGREWLGGRERIPRDLEERIWQLEAARGVLRFAPEGEAPNLRIVGQAGTATWEDLEPALHATSLRLGLNPERGSRLIDRARRFPRPAVPGMERFGGADEHPLSVLDRPDVSGLLYDLFRLPRTTALLQDAQLCLGHVVRAARFLRSLLDEVAPGEKAVRRALVVALGLVGEPLGLEVGVPQPDDAETTEAWLLSLVLGRGLDAEPGVRLADRRAEGAARRITDKALARIESAFPWSVIE